jgi:FHS family L-fucose permease-like MFS transporter
LNSRNVTDSVLASLPALSAVYLLWGAIASLNDILIPYLKDEFALSYTQAMRIQLVFYLAYFIFSVPAGALLQRRGYRFGVQLGLITAASGCLAMTLAYGIGQYPAFLAAIFLIATGITLLQVSANPLVTLLGSSATAPSRLTLMQSFHSLGTVLGPLLGAWLIFSVAGLLYGDALSGRGVAVLVPYVFLAGALLVASLIFSRTSSRMPRNRPCVDEGGVLRLLFVQPGLGLAVLALFFYVGAEIAIGSFLVNYLGSPRLGALAPEVAGRLVAVYWGGALLGRFIGALLLRWLPAQRLLVIYALAAASLVLISLLGSHGLARAAILSVGFFNSIVFPTVFALVLKAYPARREQVSGLLCMGIVGGAVITQLQGVLADWVGLRGSFLLTVACYLYIAAYAWFGLSRRGAGETEASVATTA